MLRIGKQFSSADDFIRRQIFCNSWRSGKRAGSSFQISVWLDCFLVTRPRNRETRMEKMGNHPGASDRVTELSVIDLKTGYFVRIPRSQVEHISDMNLWENLGKEFRARRRANTEKTRSITKIRAYEQCFEKKLNIYAHFFC